MESFTPQSQLGQLLDALKISIFYGICCRFLRKTLDKNEIRKQDAIYTIIYIARNPIGRYLAWDFVRANWMFIRES